MLTQGGSNTMWFAVLWVAPKKDFAVLSVTNIGGVGAPQGCDDASAAMIAHYRKMRPNAALPATRPRD